MTPAPALWSSLPNLKAVTLSEGLRLGLIVGSLSFVVLAGQFAQSRGQELSTEATQNIMASAATAEHATTRAIRAHHKSSMLERYTAAQVRTYGELLDGLTERAEIVLTNNDVSPDQVLHLKAALRDLDETLMQTREALASVQMMKPDVSAKEAAFEDEDLRGSLVNLQNAASVAQGLLISLDRFGGSGFDDQGLRVSRTGQ